MARKAQAPTSPPVDGEPKKVLSPEERLAAKAAKNTASKATEKNWVITLDDNEMQDAALKFAAANYGKTVMTGRETAARSYLQPLLVEHIAQQWAAFGRKLPNPKIITENGEASFNFICAETSSRFSLKPDAQGEVKSADKFLSEFNVSPAVREKLAGEFVEKKAITLADIGKLKENKTPLYDKVLNLLLTANDGGVFDEDGNEVCKLSDDDMKDLLININEVTVKEGLISRLPELVKAAMGGDAGATKDQLLNLFKAFGAVSGIQWRLSQVFVQHPETAISGLLSEPAEAAPKEQVFKTTDNKFEFVVHDNVVSIFRIAEDGEKVHLGDKKCSDGNKHAINSAKLFLRDRNRLSQALAELS